MSFNVAIVSAISAGAVGLLLGLRFRVPALLAATATLVLACGAAGITWRWPSMLVVGWAIALAATMQFSYLMGVMLADGALRRRHGPAGDGKQDDAPVRNAGR